MEECEEIVLVERSLEVGVVFGEFSDGVFDGCAGWSAVDVLGWLWYGVGRGRLEYFVDLEQS